MEDLYTHGTATLGPAKEEAPTRFEDDTVHSVYNELKFLEPQVLTAANEVRDKGRKAVTKKGTYEFHKHSELVRLFAEEAEPDYSGGKRTEPQRAAMYRTKYDVERLAWIMAEREYDVAKTYLKSLEACLTSVQARAKLIRIDSDFTG